MPWAEQVERLEIEVELKPLLEVLVEAEEVEEFLLMAELVQSVRPSMVSLVQEEAVQIAKIRRDRQGYQCRLRDHS